MTYKKPLKEEILTFLKKFPMLKEMIFVEAPLNTGASFLNTLF
jgi:hypothetical protein